MSELTDTPEGVITEENPINGSENQNSSSLKTRLTITAGAVAGAGATIAPVAAADNTSVTEGLSAIGPMIDGIAGFMPSVLGLIIAIVGIVVIMIGLNFVTGILTGILDGIKGMFKFRMK